ncbi:hypothetical protein DMUE_0454 [Dictyocoela muelleri]|nr:hypothetical protein DMUE_0454 [Dictyocoela muelleri]
MNSKIKKFSILVILAILFAIPTLIYFIACSVRDQIDENLKQKLNEIENIDKFRDIILKKADKQTVFILNEVVTNMKILETHKINIDGDNYINSIANLVLEKCKSCCISINSERKNFYLTKFIQKNIPEFKFRKWIYLLQNYE